jgi:hypothetical protein
MGKLLPAFYEKAGHFLLGDLNASRAKTASNLGARTFFLLLIIYHHFYLGWPDKFVLHLKPGHPHLSAI